MSAPAAWLLTLITVGLIVSAVYAFVALDRRNRRELARAEALRPVPAAPSRGWVEKKRRRQLLVHTTTDQTLRGVLLEESPDGLVLAGVEYLGEKALTMAGQVFVPREKIAMIQLPPEAAK